MDSRTRPAPSPPATPEAPAAVVAEAPPGALARLGRLLPGVDALVRFAYRTAGASVVAVALILAVAIDAVGWTEGTRLGLALLAAVLLLPAAAAALAGWTLADLVSIPGQLRDAALQASGRASEARGARTGSRLLAVGRSLWAARGLALLSRGTWLRGVGALRFLRLASLPFALGLLALFSLNAVVIAGGVAALLVLLF